MKVRIKELAQEAKYIRHEETKIKSKQKIVNWCYAWGKPRIEPDDISQDFLKLRSHRTHEVREAARAAQLAYGFLRGIPYLEIECKRKQEKEWLFKNRITPEIKRLAKKFGNLYGKESYDEEIDKWLDTKK